LREAAELLGTSTEAVRKRATRGSLRSDKRDDGRVIVWVDDGRTEGGHHAQGEASANGGALVEVLTEQVSYLKAQLDIRTEELRRKDHIIAGLSQATAEQARTIRAIEAPASEAAEEPTEDAETVEEAPEGPKPRPAAGESQEAARGAQSRPWWRRVFGG